MIQKRPRTRVLHPDMGELLGSDAAVYWNGDYFVAHTVIKGRGFHGRGRTEDEARIAAGRLAGAVAGYMHPEPHFYAEPKHEYKGVRLRFVSSLSGLA